MLVQRCYTGERFAGNILCEPPQVASSHHSLLCSTRILHRSQALGGETGGDEAALETCSGFLDVERGRTMAETSAGSRVEVSGSMCMHYLPYIL